MSFVDQLEASFAAFGLVDVTQSYTPEDWVVANSALAAHKAMLSGYTGESLLRQIEASNTPTLRPENFTKGTVDVTKSLQIAQSYQEILIRSQKTPIGLRPTADDVVDGGIKNGSKVVLQIVPENTAAGAWDDQVKSSIRTKAVEGVIFDKFSVASFVESEDERYQIHETFGADVIQSFGRRPRFLTIAGIVVNGRIDVRFGTEVRSMDWKNAFQRAYQKQFSLKACLANRKKVRIYFQDTVYDGYLLQMTAATDAENQGISQVTVRVVVKNRYFIDQKDDNIAGTFTSGGFRLSGADVPEEFFPQDKLEFYFNQDYTEIIDGAKNLLQKEIRELAEELASVDGGVINVITPDEIIERAYTVIDAEKGDFGAQSIFDLELKQGYTEEFKLTPLLQNGDIDAAIEFVIQNDKQDPLTRRGLSARVKKANDIAEQLINKQKELDALLLK